MSYMDEVLRYEKWLADGKPPRKRMKRFQITEISAVDQPAQVGAVATITKRQESQQAAAERAFAASARQTDKLVEKWSRHDTAEALALAEQGEALMDNEDDPDRAELEAKRERGRQRFLANQLAQTAGALKMSKDMIDVEVDEDMAAQAIAQTSGCSLGDAYRAIGTARKMASTDGGAAMQKLFTPQVQALLGSDADIVKEAGERAAEIRKSGDRRTKGSSHREALREQLRDNPEQFGYE